ncbi:hypothetical protein CKJ56_15700 [Mycobacterium intracellulare subsp. chimaera]|nr:hypothetical protein CKJ58_15530 [Mycobacterium intracellulare subsp. chimaera]OSC24101.1 hypothetical protein B8W68_17480 [Mycobacterium paraintracellulare]PBA56230.1 hypothetical protein CKJ57_16985 [Mycobacterium intracellulare subsp. chimaera]PBA60780.1 hypothetical protein CKJ56_15700 [Mycobacterium intracellulare subsp. chimaera]
MVARFPRCQRSHCALDRRDPTRARRRRANAQRVEKTMMSTLLGMLMMMPVVFGVGGYVLVSRRP